MPTAQVSVAVQLDRVRLVAINDLNGRATPLAALAAKDVTASASGTLAQAQSHNDSFMSDSFMSDSFMSDSFIKNHSLRIIH